MFKVEIDSIGRLSDTVEEWELDLSGPEFGPNLADTLHVALAVPEDEAERWSRRKRIVLNIVHTGGDGVEPSRSPARGR